MATRIQVQTELIQGITEAQIITTSGQTTQVSAEQIITSEISLFTLTADGGVTSNVLNYSNVSGELTSVVNGVSSNTVTIISGRPVIHHENARLRLSPSSFTIDGTTSNTTFDATFELDDAYVITGAALLPSPQDPAPYTIVTQPTSSNNYTGRVRVPTTLSDAGDVVIRGTIDGTLDGEQQATAPVTATFTVAPEPAQWYARASFLPPSTIGGSSGDFVVGNEITGIQGESGRTLFLWIPTGTGGATANFQIGSGISILVLEDTGTVIDNHRLYNAGALSGGNITLTVRRI